MNEAILFLRNKGLLIDDCTKWIVTFEDGKTVDFVELLAEFKSQKLSIAEKQGVSQLQYWQDNHKDDFTFEDFKITYPFYCSICKGWYEDQCICYAR